MSNLAASKVDGIIKALSGLENDIEGLNEKMTLMKKNLNSQVNREIEKNMEKVTEIATKEAELLISQSKQKAQTQADSIIKSGEEKLVTIQNQINKKFDESVDYVVSTVLKP